MTSRPTEMNKKNRDCNNSVTSDNTVFHSVKNFAKM